MRPPKPAIRSQNCVFVTPARVPNTGGNVACVCAVMVVLEMSIVDSCELITSDKSVDGFEVLDSVVGRRSVVVLIEFRFDVQGPLTRVGGRPLSDVNGGKKSPVGVVGSGASSVNEKEAIVNGTSRE